MKIYLAIAILACLCVWTVVMWLLIRWTNEQKKRQGIEKEDWRR